MIEFDYVPNVKIQYVNFSFVIMIIARHYLQYRIMRAKSRAFEEQLVKFGPAKPTFKSLKI